MGNVCLRNRFWIHFLRSGLHATRLAGGTVMRPSRDLKKIALSKAEGFALDWIVDHGETFPDLRDLFHEIAVRVEKEREQL